MTKPNVYQLTKGNKDRSYLTSDDITINKGPENEIPARVIFVKNDEIWVCTDFYEDVCEICSKEDCYFNPLYDRRRER